MDRGVAFSRVEDADTLPACFEDEPPSFRGRWRKLACYAALLCCNQIAWISYATVPADSAKVLGVSPALVTLLAASYSILYLPGSVLAARALHRGGLRCCLLESARLMVAGTLLKVAGTVVVVVAPAPGARALAYALSLFGQVLLASAQPHLVNTPTAVAQAFFPAAERDFAGILGLLGPVVGQALGEALAPAVVCGVQQRGGSAAAGLLTLNILQLFPLSVAAVLAANLFSGNAARKPSKQGASLFADWWRLVRSDANLRTLWVAVCVGMSIFNALLAMAAQW
ncbi:hypothetical protein M885DRAFT_496204 [Pelagophyceae sp. CCMP2097]|nr:hypothetical protein M885DRAFT_496204 [Pelagophyceae sp. CCMP2097]